MNERLPSVCLVMFCVDGLFVTYQLAAFIVALPPAIVSQTLVVPATRWPQPPWHAGRPAVVAAGDPAVEEIEGQDERLRVAGPVPRTARVARAAAAKAGGAGDAAAKPPLLLPARSGRLCQPVPTGSMRA